MSDKNVYIALLSIQDKLKNPSKTRKGNFGKYAELPDILDQVKPILKDAGLFLTQLIQRDQFGSYLETRLIHADSQTELNSKAALFLEKQTPQGMGAATTYQRRYAACALLCIAGEEDDDGQAAETPAKQPVAKAVPVAKKSNAPEWLKIAYRDLKALAIAGDERTFAARWSLDQSNIDDLQKSDPKKYDDLSALFNILKTAKEAKNV